MQTRSRGALVALLVWAATLVPTGAAVWPLAAAQTPAARILAPANRQVAWLNLEAPRPQTLTHFDQPAYVTDVAASTRGPLAVIAVFGPQPASGALGADLMAVNLASAQVSTLVGRAEPTESLGAPAWWFDDSSLIFERQDRSGVGIGLAGMSSVRYPTRIEMAQPDGSGRTVLVDNGRQPAPAPDGSGFAFVRTSDDGTGLLIRAFPDLSERVLIQPGLFRDVASPRYSPQGDRLAFMAPEDFVASAAPQLLDGQLFGAGIASAHGLPWDVWLVNGDGSGLRRLAQLAADDGTVSWSPDGTQLFVYGGGGSFLVDAESGEVTPLAYLSGYGSTAWLPD